MAFIYHKNNALDENRNKEIKIEWQNCFSSQSKFLQLSIAFVTMAFCFLLLITNIIFNLNSYFLCGLGVIIFFFAISSAPVYKHIDKISNNLWGVGFGILNIFLHLLYAGFSHNKVTQISDFLITLTVAETGEVSDFITYYKIAPHKFLYPFVLHHLGLDNQNSIIVFQAIVVSVAVFFIYCITARYFSKGAAIAASFLYTFFPGRLMYSSIVNEEHVSVDIILLVILLSFYLVDSIESKQENWSYIIKNIVLSVFIGIISGVGVFFKDWSIIFFIAFLITSLLDFGKERRRKILLFFCIGIILAARMGTKKITFNFIENTLRNEVHRNALPMYMFYTLYPTSNGAYNADLLQYCIDSYESNDWDYKVTDKELLLELSEELKKHKNLIIPLLFNKGRMAYGNASILGGWAFNEYTAEFRDSNKKLCSLIGRWDDIWFITILMMSGIVSVANVWVKDKKIFLLNLTLLGCILSVVFIEGQGRYKYSILPVWCIFAGILLKNEILKFLKK